jgi:hypothetical protein
MLVIYVNSGLNCKSGREGRVPLLDGSCLPFPPLLWLSREFFHSVQENRDSNKIVGIYKSLPDECKFWEQGCAVSFWGICVSNWCKFSVGGFLFKFAGLKLEDL